MEKFTIDITKPGALAKATEKILESVQTKTTKAAINTVNIQAAITRNQAIKNIKNTLITRNTFTERSIVYSQCPKNTKEYKNIQSQVGALDRAEYMERQEEGGIRKPKKGKRLAIPTTQARGGTNTNLVRKKYKLGQFKEIDRSADTDNHNFRSKLVAKAFIAWKEKMAIYYNKGLFAITNFKKNKDNISFTMQKIYTTKYTQTITPKNKWLEPATIYPAEQQQNIFNSEMEKLK